MNWKWLFTDKDGNVGFAQKPNLAISLAFTAWLLAKIDFLDLRDYHESIYSAALVFWSLDEVFRGTYPARRILGAVVFGFVVNGLLG